jgi:uncharacterized iron-regulated membrane protein
MIFDSAAFVVCIAAAVGIAVLGGVSWDRGLRPRHGVRDQPADLYVWRIVALGLWFAAVMFAALGALFLALFGLDVIAHG